MKQRSIVTRLLAWFSRNARDLPWRRTRDPYAIWVSEIMLQQTRVNAVVPYWEHWMERLPNVASLAKAKPELLHKLWEGLGYYTRVRNLQRAAQQIVAEHGGCFPRKFESILALPGVGRYTAGAICSIAFNQPQPIVDGNVIRVLTRLHGIAGDPRSPKVNARLWKLADELVHEAAATVNGSGKPPACSHLNQALMELGAVICTPRQPLCGTCPLASQCVARQQGRVHRFPALCRRARPTPRRFAAFIASDGERLLVRQRPSGTVNAHLWEFPNRELPPGDGDLKQAARSVLGVLPRTLKPLLTIKHAITRYRITLEVYLVAGARGIPASKGRWVGQSGLRQLAFTAAHKKILRRLDAG